MGGQQSALLSRSCSALQEAGDDLLILIFLLLAPHSEVPVQLVGSSASKPMPLTISKALSMRATPGTGAMINYTKPKISDLEIDIHGVC